MTHKLIVHAEQLGSDQHREIGQYASTPEQHQSFWCWNTVLAPPPLDEWRKHWRIDCNLLSAGWDGRKIRLIISDMDSTLINIECIDEIAAAAGIRDQVAAITERAMAGKICFADALKERLSLLAGTPVKCLEEVCQNRMQINPGGEKMLLELHRLGIAFALVSGGFTYFTEHLQNRYPIAFSKAHVLQVRKGRLTGQLNSSIVDQRSKRLFFSEVCRMLSLDESHTIAIGDGANDVQMLRAAGLSVAWKAKKVVYSEANWRLEHSGLDSILAALAIHPSK